MDKLILDNCIRINNLNVNECRKIILLNQSIETQIRYIINRKKKNISSNNDIALLKLFNSIKLNNRDKKNFIIEHIKDFSKKSLSKYFKFLDSYRDIDNLSSFIYVDINENKSDLPIVSTDINENKSDLPIVNTDINENNINYYNAYYNSYINLYNEIVKSLNTLYYFDIKEDTNICYYFRKKIESIIWYSKNFDTYFNNIYYIYINSNYLDNIDEFIDFIILVLNNINNVNNCLLKIKKIKDCNMYKIFNINHDDNFSYLKPINNKFFIDVNFEYV